MQAPTRKTGIKLPPERSAPDISPDIPNLTAADNNLMAREAVIRDCILENVATHDCPRQTRHPGEVDAEAGKLGPKPDG